MKTTSVPSRTLRWVLLSVAILATGCSARQAYSTLQNTGRLHAECERRQSEADAARCEADYSQTYDQYERERREALGQQD